jgi:hypothetical protein
MIRSFGKRVRSPCPTQFHRLADGRNGGHALQHFRATVLEAAGDDQIPPRPGLADHRE